MRPRWDHWFRDVIPQERTTVQQRQEARRDREEERQRQLRAQQEKERKQFKDRLADMKCVECVCTLQI